MPLSLRKDEGVDVGGTTFMVQTVVPGKSALIHASDHGNPRTVAHLQLRRGDQMELNGRRIIVYDVRRSKVVIRVIAPHGVRVQRCSARIQPSAG